MYIIDYFHQIEEIIINCPAIITTKVSYEQRTRHLGFIKGTLTFSDISQLHFKEFINTEMGINKYKYGYYYQKENDLIFRYDNYIHPGNSNLPIHHKHIASAPELIAIQDAPSLDFIIKEIISLLP